MNERDLGRRAPAVFEAFLDGRDGGLHPADRYEASEFWTWLGEFERPSERVRPRASWPRWVAAAVLVAGIFGSIAWIARAPHDPARTVVAGHAERRVIELTDGSTVTLAADSRVEIAYTPAERRLRLTRGEALFVVAHNRSRPFIVETRHGEVKAVGTAFDVSVAPREAQLTVVEGVVRIALGNGTHGATAEPIEKLARKGERLVFGVDTAGRGGRTGFIRQAGDVDVEGATAWTRGQLVFHGEPLVKVIAEINRYARDRVVLTDPTAGSIPVYGVVDQGDTAAIRDLVANPHAVAIERAE
jgi:transmembrane sensor